MVVHLASGAICVIQPEEIDVQLSLAPEAAPEAVPELAPPPPAGPPAPAWSKPAQ